MKKYDITKWILYALLAVLLFTLRDLLFPLLKVWGAAPLFGGAVTVALAMFEGPFAGGAFGVLCGALLYQTPGGGELLYILIYAAGGAFVGAMCAYMFRRRFATALMWSFALNALATLSYMLIFFVIPQRGAPGALFAVALAEILYSTAVTPLAYFPVRTINRRRTPTDE